MMEEQQTQSLGLREEHAREDKVDIRNTNTHTLILWKMIRLGN
jgi:hypothetical protein